MTTPTTRELAMALTRCAARFEHLLLVHGYGKETAAKATQEYRELALNAVIAANLDEFREAGLRG